MIEPVEIPKSTRRSFLKKAALAVAGLIALPPFSYGYARYAEPKWLDINPVTLHLQRLPKEMSGLRVAQFSDLHLGFHYNAEDLSRLSAAVNSTKPDVICFTGDLVDYALGTDAEIHAVIDALTAMEAPLGKFAVLGNHDYFKSTAAIIKMLSAGGFTVLRNDAARVERGGAAIWVAGLDDQWMGRPDLNKTLMRPSPDEFVLMLCHCPDFADITVEFPVDVQLSGHSHGGQVRLPFYGHIVVPKYARKYVKGLYSLRQGKLQIYVNRGIGVSQYPVRFWCRPELTVFTLRS